VSSTTLTAVTPAVSSPGTVTVTVTNPDGQIAFLGAAQLLPNPGFESGALDWQTANGGGTATIANSSAGAHSGTWYGDETTTASTNHPIIFGTQANGSTYFPVAPGDTISFGGWAYRAAGTDGFARYSIAAYDSNKANPNYRATTPNTVTTASWTQGTGSYTVGSGKAFVTFYFEAFGATTSSEAWCDDASLVQTHGIGYQYSLSGAPLRSISVTPASSTLARGSNLQFTATGHYSDATTQDLTTSVSWASTTTSVATISNASGTQGQATGVSLGATTISATSGSIVGSTGLTVTSVPAAIAPQLMSMSIFAENFGPTTLPGNYWPTVPFGSLRLWDTHTGWPDLEPSQGAYRWDLLNGWLNLAQSHGMTDILYTFGSTAPWAATDATNTTCKYGPGTCTPPSDLDSQGLGSDQMWIDFVTNLATVGKGRIKYYQLWDTPQDPTHWTGNVQQLVRMSQDAYTTIKSIDPSAKILSPPSGAYKAAPSKCVIANRALPFFKNGGGQWVDVVSFNTYYDNVAEDIIPVVQCFMENVLVPYGQMSKPLWASEGGWGTSSDLWNQDLQAAFLARSYLVLLSQGVRRFYWYSWNNPNWGTLWNKNAGIQLPGKAYAQVHNWLAGRTLTQPCTTDGNEVWTCVLMGANGYQSQATWVQGASQAYTVPAPYVNYRDLMGMTTAVTTGQQITITSSPILLQNQ